jgi:hypothetical protein
LNLAKETMGKIGELDEDGIVRYPIDVSYNMGWQKAKKTYDSLLGHGPMIGNATGNVVAFQNFSSACGFCDRHQKKEAKNAKDNKVTNDRTNDMPVPSLTADVANVPVPIHSCPKNYSGSSKGMEAKAALNCVEQVWSHKEVSAFISIICINTDATTKAYLQHSFADLLAKNLPHPLNKKGEPKSGKANDKGKLQKDQPVIKFLADLSHRVCTFAKYLYALKNVSKSESEMTDIDCLRLKRN